MGFNDFFGRAWKDYKRNFSAITALMTIFVVIPGIIFSILNTKLVESFSLGTFVLWTIILVIYLFTSTFAFISFTAVSLKNDRFTLKKALATGRTFYFSALGYSIVLCLFLLGLFILLIIPGIIFLVYWIFGIYVFIDRRLGILKSLKESRKLVRGRWWTIFGYGLLFAVLGGAILVVLSLVSIYSSLVGDFLIQICNNILIAPLCLLFLKHAYLDYKKKR